MYTVTSEAKGVPTFVGTAEDSNELVKLINCDAMDYYSAEREQELVDTLMDNFIHKLGEGYGFPMLFRIGAIEYTINRDVIDN